MRPTDPDGYRDAWAALERLWAQTVDRARGLDRCLGAILNEEWEHRLYAERDLDVLAERGPR